MGSQALQVRARTAFAAALVALLALGAAGCNKRSDTAAEAGAAAAPSAAGDSAPVGGTNRNGSKLAYEHDVAIKLDGAKIAGNLASVREACMGLRFGECTVLGEELAGGETPTGMLRMRSAPAAVGPLVKLAAAGGEVAQRNTHAEDLADAVQENGMRRQRLELQHRKLMEILDRRDLRPEDIYAITEKLASLEAGLQAAEQENAQLTRRVETNLLTINFAATGISAPTSRVGETLRSMTGTWDASLAVMIAVVGALLPWAILIGAVWWIGRRVRAWRPASRAPQDPPNA